MAKSVEAYLRQSRIVQSVGKDLSLAAEEFIHAFLVNLIPTIENILLFIGVRDTYEHLVVAASTQVFFVLIVFHETDGITNFKQLAASVTLLDFILMLLCVDGAVNIVLYDELSDFRADIVLVTLLLCLHYLRVFLIQCRLPSSVFLRSL